MNNKVNYEIKKAKINYYNAFSKVIAETKKIYTWRGINRIIGNECKFSKMLGGKCRFHWVFNLFHGTWTTKL